MRVSIRFYSLFLCVFYENVYKIYVKPQQPVTEAALFILRLSSFFQSSSAIKNGTKDGEQERMSL